MGGMILRGIDVKDDDRGESLPSREICECEIDMVGCRSHVAARTYPNLPNPSDQGADNQTLTLKD